MGRRLVAVAVAAVIVVGLVSCGGKSAQAAAQDAILGAAQATFGAGTAQVLLGLAGADTTADGEGEVDFDALQSQVAVDLTQGTTTVWVDGVTTLVGLDDVVTQVDPDQLDPLGDLASVLALLQPAQALLLLDGLTGDVTIVGDDDVDGVSATHYTVTVDVSDALDNDDLTDDQRAALQAMVDLLDLDSLEVDVWLDDDGRVVQYVATVTLPNGDDVTVTLNYQDFGRDVHIEIPDPSGALSPEEFGTATADVSGRDWRGQTRITDSTNPGWYAVGPQDPTRLNLRCRPNGSCTNAVSDTRWTASGPGEWTITYDVTGDCTDTVTGAVTSPGGYHETGDFTWTVSGYENGVATELTQSGVIHGEVTASGRADGCTFDGSPGGDVEGTAHTAGQATRG